MPEGKKKRSLSRVLRVTLGRINRKDVLTYLFFVLLAAVFWLGVTLQDQQIEMTKILEEMLLGNIHSPEN